MVDDDLTVRRVMERALRQGGYTTVGASDGVSALLAMETQAVDALVTDVRMQGIDGPALVKEARRLRPTLRVLYVTGWIDVLNGLKLERRDWLLEKPFRPATLLQMMTLLIHADSAHFPPRAHALNEP